MRITKWSDELKPSNEQDYSGIISVTDQRAILNNPEAAVSEFLIPSDVMEELESEEIEDFDNDLLSYDERAELGEDIATAKNLPSIKAKAS